jgi:hypothetical protein
LKITDSFCHSSGSNRISCYPKVKAGYGGYADPEYIEQLQQISLPFLGVGKYRGFPVEGIRCRRKTAILLWDVM